MKPALQILAVLLVCILVVSDPTSGAAREDGRLTVAPDAHPWRSIGRLNVAGYRRKHHCTATLISADVILTARHCLKKPRGDGLVQPDRVHFLAGYSRGEHLEHHRGRKAKIIGFDMALVWLATRSKLEPVRIAPLGQANSALFQAGYSADKGHVLTVDPVCKVLGRGAPNMLKHNCEAISGDSGAPIFVDAKDGLAIVAIHIGRNGRTGIGEFVPVEKVQSLLQD